MQAEKAATQPDRQTDRQRGKDIMKANWYANIESDRPKKFNRHTDGRPEFMQTDRKQAEGQLFSTSITLGICTPARLLQIK